jgi:putative endopeptidase
MNDTPSKKGINKANLDTTVSAKSDFYEYACGGWKKANPLTAEFSRYGTFDMLRENNRKQLKELITTLAENPDSKVKGTIAQKVCDLYAQGMDETRLNSEGAAPLMPYVRKVESFKREDLAENLAWLHSGIATGTLFSSGVGTDAKDSDMNILHIGETGLGLGDRDYYLEKSDNNKRIMDAYEVYVKRLMELIGFGEQRQEEVWKNVISLETEFATHKMTREERRNPVARYNITTLDELCVKYPNIAWQRYFKALGLTEIKKINVLSPQFYEALNGMLPNISDTQLTDYFLFNLVAESTGVLSDDFVNASFDLYDRVMSGKEELEPRWKRAMRIPNSMLGEAVGELYVEKYFPKENKEYMRRMVENLRIALGTHIDNLTWMSESTKAKAHEKLSTFTVKIGYPDKWKDYSAIQIDPGRSYLENVLSAAEWYVKENYNKLGKPVDKDEWHMTPQTVNAYYNPTTNEICFPAGILQAPYYDPNADDAQNYGAIGVVIGHEMTHGFDDQGRQFDKEGNLNEWWQKEDAEKFKKLSDGLVEQFNAIEVSPGVHANGRYTLGENIADQGGLRISLTAYRNAVKERGMHDIDGFSAMQRFYLAYANVWASNIRDEEILCRVKSDPHSIEKNRVNDTLKNISEFHEAFSIKEGDNMYLPEEKRVVIW